MQNIAGSFASERYVYSRGVPKTAFERTAKTAMPLIGDLVTAIPAPATSSYHQGR